jgi:hypothetical protein
MSDSLLQVDYSAVVSESVDSEAVDKTVKVEI